MRYCLRIGSPSSDTPNTYTLCFRTKSPHTDTTNAERATRFSSLIGLNKGQIMNSLDILIGLGACALGFLFMVIGYSVGFKHGHGEGFVRGRAIAKALKDMELSA